MKKIYQVIVYLLIFAILSESAFAQNAASIAVSCSIPEVPGLNAPLIEERSVRIIPGELALDKKDKEPQSPAQTESEEKADTETDNQIMFAKQDSSLITETTYSR